MGSWNLTINRSNAFQLPDKRFFYKLLLGELRAGQCSLRFRRTYHFEGL